MPHPFGSPIAEWVGTASVEESLPFFVSFLKGTCCFPQKQQTPQANITQGVHRLR
jgi:hypothetical protein